MRPQRILADYLKSIQTMICSSKAVRGQAKIEFELDKRYGGRRALLKINRIEFADGASLEAIETVEVDSNTIVRPRYSYQYPHTNGYYFRYDREPGAVVKYVHEKCHLHVIVETPRYPTHATSLEEVFRFIEGTFYHQ